MSVLLVLTNLPDRAAAERLADTLVERRLAACVNVLAPCRSVYRWKDGVQHDEEHPLLVKTTAARYAALEAEIGTLGERGVDQATIAGLTERLEGLIRTGDTLAQQKTVQFGLRDERVGLVVADVSGHGDHRIVMALAIAGLGARGTTRIATAESVGVTFPNFVELMQGLGAAMELE